MKKYKWLIDVLNVECSSMYDITSYNLSKCGLCAH